MRGAFTGQGNQDPIPFVTLMAVVVIPLGCITARRQFYLHETDDGQVVLSPDYYRIEGIEPPRSRAAKQGRSLGLRVWQALVGGLLRLAGGVGRLVRRRR